MFNKKYFWLLLLLLFIIPIISAKEFNINNYEITYFLEPSGKINVSETIEYQLSGCFKELFLQRPNIEITNPIGKCIDAACSFEYKQINTVSGDPELILKGDFCNQKVTANFNYTIKNQIKEQEDTIQFYYKVYPEKTAKSTNVKIIIYFPGDINQTTRYIHSKDYLLEINDNVLIISKKVGAYEIIEVNILMPKSWFTGNLPKEYYTASQINDLENNWQKDYDIYLRDNVKQEPTTGVLILYFFLIFGVPIILLFLIWLIFGKDIPVKKTGYLGSYERELPGPEDPIQAHYLITGEMSNYWFLSAIMYLVWKKQYELIKTEEKSLFNTEKYKLVKIKNSKNIELPKYVLKVKNFFEKYYPNGEINLDDLRAGKTENNKDLFFSTLDFQMEFTEMQKGIKKDLDDWNKKNKYFIKIGIILAWIAIFMYFNFVVYGISILFKGYLFPNWISFVFFGLIFLIIILNLAIRSKFSFSVIFGRFSKEGRVKNLQWTNFKKYITDFSLIKQHPPQHIILWEEYMVYATAFGVAKETSKAIKTAMPEEVSKNQQFIVYSSFTQSSIAASTSSYGGGGHSGGGGFGGGGGGGGAGAR